MQPDCAHCPKIGWRYHCSYPGEPYELRLLAVRKALEQLRDLVEQKKHPKSSTAPASKDKIYLEAETRLGAYINSAARVLKVRAICEENAEIEAALQLVFDGVRLPWSDFYFEDSEYFRCFCQVRDATVQVPIAIRGAVKSIKTINGKTEQYTVLDLVRPFRNGDQPHSCEAACISVWSADLSAFDQYMPEQEIIAFGLWQDNPIKDVDNRNSDSMIKVFRNYELRFWPVTRSQLCHA